MIGGVLYGLLTIRRVNGVLTPLQFQALDTPLAHMLGVSGPLAMVVSGIMIGVDSIYWLFSAK